jgi:hypothetical protein
MLGYGDDEFWIRLRTGAAIHPLDLAGVEATLRCHIEGHERKFEYQFRLLHLGQYRWASG